MHRRRPRPRPDDRRRTASDAGGADRPTAAPDGAPPRRPRLAAAVQRECLRRGLIVELGGRHASVVRLLPPLTISDEQADAVLDRLADAVGRRPARTGEPAPRTERGLRPAPVTAHRTGTTRPARPRSPASSRPRSGPRARRRTSPRPRPVPRPPERPTRTDREHHPRTRTPAPRARASRRAARSPAGPGGSGPRGDRRPPQRRRAARLHRRPAGAPRPRQRGPGRGRREPAALLGAGERPPRPRHGTLRIPLPASGASCSSPSTTGPPPAGTASALHTSPTRRRTRRPPTRSPWPHSSPARPPPAGTPQTAADGRRLGPARPGSPGRTARPAHRPRSAHRSGGQRTGPPRGPRGGRSGRRGRRPRRPRRRLRPAHRRLHRATAAAPRRRRPTSSSPPNRPSSSATRCTRPPRAAKVSPRPKPGSTRPSCAAPSPCTGWPWTRSVLATRLGLDRARPPRPGGAAHPAARRGRAAPARRIRRALPLHPWQVRELRHRPQTAALLDAGLLRDLGPHGAPWHPTSSVRTVYRPGAPAMLKLSLGLRITNSRRENLRKELHRGVEVHRLLRSGLSEQWQAAHPGFDIVRDPAWLAVDGPDGEPVAGPGRDDPAQPVRPGRRRRLRRRTRLAPPPARGRTGRPAVMRSRLAETRRPPRRTHRPPARRRRRRVVPALPRTRRPPRALARRHEAGIALEAHQQNTLLLLDADGWPVGRPLPRQPGLLLPRVPPRRPRRAGCPASASTATPSSPTRSPTNASPTTSASTTSSASSAPSAPSGSPTSSCCSPPSAASSSDVAAGPDRLRTPLPALPARLARPALQGQPAHPPARPGRTRRPVDTQSVYVTIANPLSS